MNGELHARHLPDGPSQFTVASPRVQNVIAALLILFFAAINLSSVFRNFSLTTDEDKHILYSKQVIEGNTDRFDDSKMPVTALNMIPQKLASFLEAGKLKQLLSRLYTARAVTILFSCLLAILIFFWSRSLYGFPAGLISLLLYILDPNIIAHSQLVTTDLYVTCAISYSFYFLWKFANERSPGSGLASLILLGISQLTKYTAIVLFPLFLFAIMLFDLANRKVPNPARPGLGSRGWRYIKYIVLASFVTLLVINIGFLFNRTFTSFGDYQFRSGLFNELQTSYPVLNSVRIPVPYPYLQGIDAMLSTEQTGNFSGNIYFLGQVSSLKGFPGYYFVASLFKVPIATQVIILLAFIIYFIDAKRRSHFWQNEFFLLLPVLFFTLYFNFFFNTQIGIRYYLPVFPFLYVFSGSLFIGWKSFSAIQKTASIGLLVYLGFSMFSYYPYHISYFNELVLDRTQAYKYLADSNLDWNQSKNELRQYLSEHPGAIYKPNKVRSGRIVVRVNDLVGVTVDPAKYAWLRENFEPVETIAYTYLVYKISPQEIENLCATSSYCDQ